MRKLFLSVCAIVAGSAFAVKPSGSYLTWYGYNAAQDSNGSGSSFYGAMSGLSSSYISQSGFFGMNAGYKANCITRSFGLGNFSMNNADHLEDCVFVGFNAGQNSSHCTNCIFIGANVGRYMTYDTGAVVIGDVLVHTNGVTTVKGLNALNNNGNNIVTRGFILKDVSGAFLGYNSQHNKWWFTGEADSAAFASASAYSGGVIDSFGGGYNTFGIDSLKNELVINKSTMDEQHIFITDTCLKYESGSLNVYTNGAKAGTLIMKDQYVNSLPIKDEDTGEKYMIKIKSGELKLYKVSD